MDQIKRATAYKLRIGDIKSGNTIFDQDKFKFIELGNKQIIRVNVVANVIEKYTSEQQTKYISFTVDDASEQIKIKAFGDEVEKFLSIEQGNTVMIIGKLRSFNNEIYISPEIIRPVDPRYLMVRKLEIEKSYPVPNQADKKETRAIRDEIIDMIKEGEENGGIETEQIIMKLKFSPDIINQEIHKLLEEGLAYEPRPGKIRYLG